MAFISLLTVDAVAALEQLQADGEDGLKLFRAELEAIRAQTRTSIDAAARNQIISKALAWVYRKDEERGSQGDRGD